MEACDDPRDLAAYLKLEHAHICPAQRHFIVKALCNMRVEQSEHMSFRPRLGAQNSSSGSGVRTFDDAFEVRSADAGSTRTSQNAFSGLCSFQCRLKPSNVLSSLRVVPPRLRSSGKAPNYAQFGIMSR